MGSNSIRTIQLLLAIQSLKKMCSFLFSSLLSFHCIFLHPSSSYFLSWTKKHRLKPFGQDFQQHSLGLFRTMPLKLTHTFFFFYLNTILKRTLLKQNKVELRNFTEVMSFSDLDLSLTHIPMVRISHLFSPSLPLFCNLPEVFELLNNFYKVYFCVFQGFRLQLNILTSAKMV